MTGFRRWRVPVAALALAAVALVVGGLLRSGWTEGGSGGTDGTAGPGPFADAADVRCPSRAEGRSAGRSLGPLVLVGASRAASRRPDAFGGHGYKLSVTLPEGVTAALSVPKALRSSVGLVYTREAQIGAVARGVSGADHAVRFAACSADGEPGRSGWPGGIVVDRRRRATLVVALAGGTPVKHRVSLGRRC